MNATTGKVSAKEVQALGEAMIDSMDSAVLARQAKMEAAKKHGITAVKILGLIGLGVAGTIGFDKFKARKANNTPALGYEPQGGNVSAAE